MHLSYCHHSSVIKAVKTSILQLQSAVTNLPLPQRLKQFSRLVKPECDIRQNTQALKVKLPHPYSHTYSLYAQLFIVYHHKSKQTTFFSLSFSLCPSLFSVDLFLLCSSPPTYFQFHENRLSEERIQKRYSTL